VVDLLVRNGADVNLAFADGRTPLYLAAERGNADVAQLLIAHGANVNAEAKGRTALKAARKRGNLGIIGLLLAHGATE
jgi:ankyrin repeat protein